jgi:hypothetical protein
MTTRTLVFSTGFEYTFSFGVQPITDLSLFSGYEDENKIWIWLDEEVSVSVLKQLYKYEDKGFECRFYKYDKNKEGTENIYNYELFGADKLQSFTREDLAAYRLGCVIYHQLLYTNILTARFKE